MRSKYTKRCHSLMSIVASLMVFCLSFGFTSNLCLLDAAAVSATSSYENLKNDPANQEFIQRFIAGGATEAQLQSMLQDLDQQVQLMGPLNDANFNSIMFDALQEVLSWRKNNGAFRAILTAFPDEINYTITNHELAAGLIPLRNAVRNAMLGTGSTTPTTTPTTGTTTPQTADPLVTSIRTQLQQNSPMVSLQTTGNAITITGSIWPEINQAGATVDLSINKVILRIPANAISITSTANLSLGATTLSSTASEEAVNILKPTQTLAGSIYDLNATTEASILGFEFQKPINVTIPYDSSKLGSLKEESLDAYYYNDLLEIWTAMHGTINKSNKTISFDTLHFSKYAALAYDASKEVIVPTKEQETKPQPPATIDNKTSHFSDITSHWAKPYIEQMVSQGLLSGVSPTQFAPDRRITRAEFAAILVRALKIPATNIVKGQFDDVAANQWYFTPVNEAAKAGIISGTSTSTFEPNRPVTREQMAVMISRAMAYRGKNIASNEDQLNIFTDRGKISSWARQGVAAAVANGIVKGRGAGTFAPADNATRAEGAVMILNMLK